jgi:hypothetical protein
MRRFRFSRIAAFAFAVVLCSADRLLAQSGSAGEGALDLLLPTGSRAIGMGQAAVATAWGADGVWWNPALISRTAKTEVAYHFAQASLFAVNDNTLSLAQPVPGVGAVAVTARLIDYGQQPAADLIGPTGLLNPRTLLTVASFGAPVGTAAIGLSFKYFRQDYACSGECPNAPPNAATTSAIDIGVIHAARLGPHAITLGASLTNVGRALQVKDAPQADPLPRRVQVGVSVAPRLARMPAAADALVAVDLVARTNGIGTPGVRIGTELAWEDQYQLRGGYAINAATGTGFSIGVGVNTGKLHIDLARFMSALSAATGDTPTFLTMRYRF